MNITLLYGGSCAERFVSFDSAVAIHKALTFLGHQVTSVDPALTTQTAIDQINRDAYLKTGYATPDHPDHLQLLFDHLKTIERRQPDIVFNALHGGYGEDGFVQDCLDRLQIPYTGSGAITSKMVMNKHVAKQIMRQAGIPTPDWVRLTNIPNDISFIAEKLGFPLVVKPNNGGSSVGLTIVDHLMNLRPALELAFKEDREVLIESFIDGTELTVSIVNDKTLPVIEIRPDGGIYDYAHKYTKGLTEYRVPAPIPDELAEELQLNAYRCYQTLGMSTYGRIDYRLNEDGHFFCLEANTLPGMTSTSLVPKAADAAGMSFTQLIDTIVKVSLHE